jgi:two-component system, NarL family, nitrate/nitrite response regulator NarL
LKGILRATFNDLGNQFTVLRCMLEHANRLSRFLKYNGEVGILATAEIRTDSHRSGRSDMTSIVLGDDHTVFVESLVSVLVRQGFRVPAVARSLTGTIEAIRHHRPDICLVSQRFSDGDGLTAICRIIAVSPKTRILVLAAEADTDAMRQAIRLGAAGYVPKTWGVRKLVHTLERVIGGAVVQEAPRATSIRSDLSEAHRLAAHLTARERECLALLVEGLDTPAMTLRLGVSTTTVRSHVQALLTKLGVHSRLEAAAYAVRHNLVDHDQHGPEGRTRTG